MAHCRILLKATNRWHIAALGPATTFLSPGSLSHSHTALPSAPGVGTTDGAGHTVTEHVPGGQHHCGYHSPSHLPTLSLAFMVEHAHGLHLLPPSPV